MLIMRKLHLAAGFLGLSHVSSVPSGFVDDDIARVVDGTGIAFVWNQITDRPMLLVTNKSGLLYAIEDPDEEKPSAKLILNMTDRTCDNGERGLQGVVAHPNFRENKWLYLFYTTLPDTGTECLLEDSVRGPRNRLSRMKVGSDNMVDRSTEEVLLITIPLFGFNHNGGAVLFGNDGHLYVTLGDGGSRGDLYSQKKNILLGKVLRITDEGGIPMDNPYLGSNSVRCHLGVVLDESRVCQEIYSIGLRNPFRFAMDMNTKDKVRFLISDVGGNTWEEIDEGGAGLNYGWPVREGPCMLASVSDCEPTDGLYADPLYWYLHTDKGGCAVGGTFIPKEAGWPQEYEDGFLFADFVFGEISLLTKTATPCRHCLPPVPAWSNVTFHEWPRPVDLVFGPYKNRMALYYTARLGSKNVRRIRFLGGNNNAPRAVITSNATKGATPLIIEFDAFESSDLDGDDIKYEWDFGKFPRASSNKSSVIVTFDEPGVYTISLTVQDTSAVSNTASIEIQVGTPPVVIIDSPSENAMFAVGDVFVVKGRATDEDGSTLLNSTMLWEVRQHHSSHYHPYMGLTDGNNFAVPPAPEPEDFLAATNSHLEFLLHVQDRTTGLSTVVSRTVMPKIVAISVDTSPSGLKVWVDDYPILTPASIVTWLNNTLTMEARDQSVNSFVTWSDEGAARHDVHISNVSTLWSFVATFDDGMTNDVSTKNPTTNPSTASLIATTGPSLPPTLDTTIDEPVSPTLSPTNGGTYRPTLHWGLGSETIVPTMSPSITSEGSSATMDAPASSPVDTAGPTIATNMPTKNPVNAATSPNILTSAPSASPIYYTTGPIIYSTPTITINTPTTSLVGTVGPTMATHAPTESPMIGIPGAGSEGADNDIPSSRPSVNGGRQSYIYVTIAAGVTAGASLVLGAALFYRRRRNQFTVDDHSTIMARSLNPPDILGTEETVAETGTAYDFSSIN